MKHCIVIGGGIIGLSTAYYLHKDGHKVIVIDKSDFSTGASYVNAGYITPSHIVPLAAPGIITKGLKWMFNSSSPFFVKPRLDKDFLEWSWLFKKSATKSKVEKAIPIIKDINILSRELYSAMRSSNDFKFSYDHKGLLMFYKTDKAGEEEWNVGKKAIELGLKVENLSKESTQKLESNVDLDIKGAVYYHSDAHMTPNNFMQELRSYLTKNGVEIIANAAVIDVNRKEENIVSVSTKNKTYIADEFIIATGSWSQNFAKKLGVKIPIQAGKGYSINTTTETGISIPAILIEAKVAVTPMQGFTRFAGTMEIGGINQNINRNRVEAIAKATQDYYKNFSISSFEKDQAKCGLRPCSPDGLPFIGKSKRIKNVIFATGHAMMGWSLGPATGKLVSELVNESKTSLDLNFFNVDRFS